LKRKLEDFDDLTPAEIKVRDELHLGEPVIIGDGQLPAEDAGPDRQIRADFLRYLCFGACKAFPGQTPETGVLIVGARITGELNLHGAEVKQDIYLGRCRLDTAPSLYDARLKNLYLSDSILPGLDGYRLQAEGGVYLRNSAINGTVRLQGAKLGADLDCDGAKLEAEGDALLCDGLTTEGAVLLSSSNIKGEVRLMGAKLGANLVCDGAELEAEAQSLSCDGLQANGYVFLRNATINGTVGLRGAKVGGNLECDGARLKAEGYALNANNAAVRGTLFLRPGQNSGVEGDLDLRAAQFGTICDHPDMWPASGKLNLDRCRYGAFVGAPVSAEERIKWLKLQPDTPFYPQPWEQCAKVLREMGHVEDARKVLMEKERLQRAERRAKFYAAGQDEFAWLAGLWHLILRVFVGYGHRPARAAAWLLGFWVAGVLIYDTAANQDAIKPNNPFVLRSAEWYACAPDYEPGAEQTAAPRNSDQQLSQLACFRAQPEAQSYPVFRAGIYSADTLLPIVHQMQEFWIPDGDHPHGRWARTFLWVQIAMGWALSLLAVAGFSGLVKSD